NEPAVRAPGEGQALPRTFESRQVLAAQRLPEAQVTLAVQAGETRPVRTEGQAKDKAGMTLIPEPFLTGRRVPNRNQIVPASGGEQAAVGAEHHAECVQGLIRKIQHDLSGACVPDGHGAVHARRSYPVALRVERRLPDHARVTFEGTNQRPDGTVYR